MGNSDPKTAALLVLTGQNETCVVELVPVLKMADAFPFPFESGNLLPEDKGLKPPASAVG